MTDGKVQVEVFPLFLLSHFRIPTSDFNILGPLHYQFTTRYYL